jgi:hypothetical protein
VALQFALLNQATRALEAHLHQEAIAISGLPENKMTNGSGEEPDRF